MSRGNRSWLLALLASLMLTSSLGGVARAQDSALTARELGLDIAVGFGSGRVISSSWTPIEVSLEPTRLFAGTITVATQGAPGRQSETREVEVPAGSNKVYRFLVPAPDGIQVQFREEGREPLAVAAPIRRLESGYLVGVLGDLPRQAPTLSAVASGERGELVAVDPAWLDRSSRSLSGLGAVIADLSDLRNLSEDGIANLVAAVSEGIELVVVADRPGELGLGALGLPAAPAVSATATTAEVVDPVTAAATTIPVLGLAPTSDAWAMTPDLAAAKDGDTVVAATIGHGLGRVTVSGVALGEGVLGADGAYWGTLAQPGARAQGAFEGESEQARIFRMASEALRSDRLGVPSLPWLTAFLVAYVLIVGPVNGFVLSRVGRRELAWGTIPAITILFAGGAFVASAGSQPSVGLAAEARWWIDGAGSEMAITALRSPTAGEHTIEFPGTDWDVLAASFSDPVAIDRRTGDTVANLGLEALQVGRAVGWRRTPDAPPLAVEADVLSDAVEVTITNTSGQPIEDLALRAGTATQRLGVIGPGETQTHTLRHTGVLPTVQPWFDEWNEMRGFDGEVDTPRSLGALLRWGILDGNPGIVWVTGTQATSGVVPEADGRIAEDQGAYIAVGVTPTVPADATEVSPFAVSRSLLPSGQGGFRAGPLAMEGQGEFLLRFRLPHVGELDSLVLTLDRGRGEGEFFPEVPEQECFESPIFDEQGNIVGSQVECREFGGGGFGGAVELPPCPPEAISCSFDGNQWEFCFADGTCEVGVADGPNIIVEPPGNAFGGARGFELYDFTQRQWIAPSGEVDADRFVGPLGDVYARSRGEFFPFDYSGRGVGARKA